MPIVFYSVPGGPANRVLLLFRAARPVVPRTSPSVCASVASSRSSFRNQAGHHCLEDQSPYTRRYPFSPHTGTSCSPVSINFQACLGFVCCLATNGDSQPLAGMMIWFLAPNDHSCVAPPLHRQCHLWCSRPLPATSAPHASSKSAGDWYPCGRSSATPRF